MTRSGSGARTDCRPRAWKVPRFRTGRKGGSGRRWTFYGMTWLTVGCAGAWKRTRRCRRWLLLHQPAELLLPWPHPPGGPLRARPTHSGRQTRGSCSPRAALAPRATGAVLAPVPQQGQAQGAGRVCCRLPSLSSCAVLGVPLLERHQSCGRCLATCRRHPLRHHHRHSRRSPPSQPCRPLRRRMRRRLTTGLCLRRRRLEAAPSRLGWKSRPQQASLRSGPPPSACASPATRAPALTACWARLCRR